MEIAKILVNSITGRCLTRKQIPARLVGGTVSVEFADSIWDRLNKTVVFRCEQSQPAQFDGKTAVIPWELLQQPGKRLYFGIWGNDPGSDLQIPLIEVPIGVVEASTDPDATPGADPTLPIWAQLQKEIEDLKKAGVSEEKIAQVVEEYLKKNPPTVTETDPTVSDWAKEEKKPTYTADEVGALSKEELSGAVNDALAQAKASGAFDGEPGAPGQDYVLTDADKAEIAEMAAELVEVPDSGGSGGAETTILCDTTLVEAVTNFTITEDKDGNALNVDLDTNILGVEIYYPEAFTVSRFSRINEQNWATANVLNQITLGANDVWTHKFFVTRIGSHRVVASCAERANKYVSPNNAVNFLSERTRQNDQYITYLQISTCTASWADYIVPAGTRILIYTQSR